MKMKDIALIMVLIGVWTSMTWIFLWGNMALALTYGLSGAVLGIVGAIYIDRFVKDTDETQI